LTSLLLIPLLLCPLGVPSGGVAVADVGVSVSWVPGLLPATASDICLAVDMFEHYQRLKLLGVLAMLLLYAASRFAGKTAMPVQLARRLSLRYGRI